jgi:DNA-binding transcriptional regulator YiaG
MEERATYGANPIRPSTLRPFAEGWEQPTADEIRAILTKAGLSGSQAASLLGIESGRTVRRWTGGQSPIPYTAWAILCQAAGQGIIWAPAGTDIERKISGR